MLSFLKTKGSRNEVSIIKKGDSGLKIAFIGLKGMPPRFGGLQFDAEQIGKRLVKRGHEVYVYSRKWYSGNNTQHEGMVLIYTPTISSRYMDVFVHSLTSVLHAIWKDYDIVHFFSFGSYFYIPILRLFGKKTVVTMGGEPWTDITYTSYGRLLARIAYNIAVWSADVVTSESLPLKEETEKYFKIPVILTPVGAMDMQRIVPSLIKEKFGLVEDGYILFLGRMERVKRIDLLINAFKEVNSPTLKLVIAGDTKDVRYKNHLLELAKGNNKIIFTGFVGGRLKEELLSNCLLFVLPSVSEGMPTAIMEAMSCGKVCLISDIPPHKWLVEDGKTGFLFETGSLSHLVSKMGKIVELPKELHEKIGGNAKHHVLNNFDWDTTTNTFERIYTQLVKQ